MRLGTGVCASCLLREGLETGVSRAAFESVIAEVDVPDTEWCLGNYEILDEIGRGGMSVIYRARQRHSRRTVAVKRMLSYQADSQETLMRFRREAEAVASLDHPNVLPIYEVSESDDGVPFFSMKFATGGSLHDAAASLRNQPRKCVQLMAKVARAVEYAHGRGVLHRDLKPGNILLDERGEPLVSDFGLAKWLNTKTDLTKSLTTFGTAGYIAPEQAEGAGADLTSAADVYSLGAVLFDLLTGRPPFLGSNPLSVIRQALERPAPKLRSLAQSLDRDLETICARCLERDPKARYQSAGDLATDLEHWLNGLPIVARPVSVPARIWRWSRRNPKLVATGAAGLLLGAAILGVYAFFLFPSLGRHPATAPEKGIAVLPFENLSRDPDNGYFAEGIQEQILTRLAKIADLKVISRTSTQRYPSKPSNLSKVAKQLGVTNIVEGSVQKAADQVRVNVQLLNAQTNSQLWGETFDRKLTDIFGIESEVAIGIAESLQAKLTSSEEQALSAKPTNNLEAYDTYLRGMAFQGRVRTSNNLLLKAIEYFQQAVQLDPNFAAAWARLSRAQAYLYFRANAASPDAARDALEQAQKLRPNSAETLLALGYYQYWVLGDYSRAKATFQLVYKLSPNNSEAAFALGAVNRREGKWEESLAWVERALALDPRNGELITMAAWTYEMLRQFPQALNLYDRALDIVTHDPDLMSFEASVYQAQGNLEQAAKFLSDITADTLFDGAFVIKIVQLRLERNYTEAVRLLQARLAQFQFTSEFNKATIQIHLAFAQRLAGDTAGAKVTAEQARNTLELLGKNQPDNYNFAACLGLAYAVLGEKDPALREAERAIMLLPTAKDAVDGPSTEEYLALIQTIFGENSRAISILRRLLQTPFHSQLYGPAPPTPALIKLDPLWDPLRGDPSFQELCDDKEP
jgi:TolB-like protein/tRNA A-37 threonylcarbamoyl transferase component Bud32/Tfp pilus assembly protein PilF